MALDKGGVILDGVWRGLRRDVHLNLHSSFARLAAAQTLFLCMRPHHISLLYLGLGGSEPMIISFFK